jgi:hypothetical protein
MVHGVRIGEGIRMGSDGETGEIIMGYMVLMHIATHEQCRLGVGCDTMNGFIIAIFAQCLDGLRTRAKLVSHFFHTHHECHPGCSRFNCQVPHS